MNLFLIAIDDDNEPDKVHELVSKHYAHTHYRLSKLTWVVASKAGSPAEIRQELNIHGQQPSVSGMVVGISEYDGYTSRSLWQLMREWQVS